MQSTSVFNDFIRDTDFLSNLDNIDVFPNAVAAVLDTASEHPQGLSEEFLVSLDLVIARLAAQVIDYKFTADDVKVFHSGLAVADAISDLIKDQEEQSRFKWRWRMAYDMTDLYLQNIQNQVAIHDEIDITRVRLDVQLWMTQDETGALNINDEKMFFHVKQ